MRVKALPHLSPMGHFVEISPTDEYVYLGKFPKITLTDQTPAVLPKPLKIPGGPLSGPGLAPPPLIGKIVPNLAKPAAG